jgi:hypothetical protein
MAAQYRFELRRLFNRSIIVIITLCAGNIQAAQECRQNHELGNRANVPAPAWFQSSGIPKADIGQGIALGKDGSLYIAGYSWGVLGKNGADKEYTPFILKYDPRRMMAWSRMIGSSNSGQAYAVAPDQNVPVASKNVQSMHGSAAYSVALDQNDNIFVVGTIWINRGQHSAEKRYDLFVAKFSSNGKKQWVKIAGTVNNDTAHSVAVAEDGSIFIAGFVNGNDDEFSYGGGSQAVLMKYDSRGNELWTRQFGGIGSDKAYAVKLSDDGDAVVVGNSDTRLGAISTISDQDLFVVRFDRNGNEKHRYVVDSKGNIRSYGLAIAENGDLYVAGIILDGGKIFKDSGTTEHVLYKLDKAGTVDWERRRPMTLKDRFSTTLLIDNHGYVMAAGSNMTCGADHDALVFRYDSNGNLVSERIFQTPGNDYFNNAAEDKEGNIYFVGRIDSAEKDMVKQMASRDLLVVKYAP